MLAGVRIPRREHRLEYLRLRLSRPRKTNRNRHPLPKDPHRPRLLKQHHPKTARPTNP